MDSSRPTLRMRAVTVLGAIWEIVFSTRPSRGRERQHDPLGISGVHGAERREQMVEQRNQSTLDHDVPPIISHLALTDTPIEASTAGKPVTILEGAYRPLHLKSARPARNGASRSVWSKIA